MHQKVLFGIIGVLLIGAAWFGYQAFVPAPATSGPITDQTEGETSAPHESINPDSIGTTTETGGGTSSGTYTLAQIAQHNRASDCYTAINGSVYNLTSFIPSHPGGSIIVQICGKDGSTMFNAQHGDGPQQAAILATLKIGTLSK